MNTNYPIAVKYDVRVARFIKSTPDNSRKYTHICLGHFDCVSFENLCLEDASPLKMIDEDRKSNSKDEDNYEYPLYLIKESREDTASFWEIDTIFSSVIRMHCDLDYNDDKTLAQYLAWEIKHYGEQHENDRIGFVDANGDNPKRLVFKPRKDKECEIYYQFYDSLELGDAVVILKSDSIVAILEAARAINEIEKVRDTYTYCTVKKAVMELSDADFYQRYARLTDELRLDYVTTRFSVKWAPYADTYFEENSLNNDKRYFITGTADILYDLGPCSEYYFLMHIRKLARSGLISNPTAKKSTITLYDAFSDTITRVGLTHPTAELSRSSPESKNVPYIDEINSFLRNIGAYEGYRWCSPIKRLLGTLRSMATNYVMDDLARLLLPSVGALISRIEFLNSTNALSNQYDQEILDFLDDWTRLTNDITHLESQLVQHPELSAIRYYIPAMVLEFEQEFVRQCSCILSKNDRSFMPMLVPLYVQDISTKCTLNPRQTDYKGACPLRTKIPLNMLYDPWTVAHQLCHEVAHYCGNDERMREYRMHCLCKCMADFVLRVWESRMGICDSNSENYEVLREKFYWIIKSEFEQDFLTEDKFHISVVEKFLTRRASIICYDERLYRDYQDLLLSDVPYDKQLILVANDIDYLNRWVTIQSEMTMSHAGHLVALCKECYADIAMIILLNCSAEDYIQCVYSSEMELIEKAAGEEKRLINWKTEPSAQLHISRFALVHFAVASIMKSDWDFVPKGWLKEADRRLEILNGRSQFFWNDTEPFELTAYLLSRFEAKAIGDYLCQCAQKLNSFINVNPSKSVQDIRLILSSVKDSTFNWNSLQLFLRKSQINDSKESSTKP